MFSLLTFLKVMLDVHLFYCSLTSFQEFRKEMYCSYSTYVKGVPFPIQSIQKEYIFCQNIYNINIFGHRKSEIVWWPSLRIYKLKVYHRYLGLSTWFFGRVTGYRVNWWRSSWRRTQTFSLLEKKIHIP